MQMRSQSGLAGICLYGTGTSAAKRQQCMSACRHGHANAQISLSSPLRLRPCVGFGVASLPCQFKFGVEVGKHKIELGGGVTGAVAVRATSDRSLDPNLHLISNVNLDPIPKLEEERVTRNRNGISLSLGLMFASWNLFNIYFNIFNKQVLKVYAFPMTVTAVQFGIGSVLVLLMWAMNLHERPKISKSQLGVITALAAVHTMGNVFTNMSLLKVAVSFTHTVKAMEPFFSVLLSALFLGQQPSGMAVATLVPVVGGVALASFTEASFNWIGFWSAMVSNLANQSRNVVSKKLMTNKEESLSNINLFSLMTIISFFFSTLIMMFTEGITFTPSYLQASGLDVREIYVRCLLMGLCFHAYQQAGYMLLEHVSPVSHSVGNCVKRVVVIVASVLFFRTPISLINSLGTGIALAGVFLYSRVNKVKRKSP